MNPIPAASARLSAILRGTTPSQVTPRSAVESSATQTAKVLIMYASSLYPMLRPDLNEHLSNGGPRLTGD